MGRNRGEGGKFTPRITDADVLRALRKHPEPVATARDLAGELDVTAETVRRRLNSLQEQGKVGRKKAGSRAVVWWPTAEAASSTAPAAPLRNLVGLLDAEAAAQAQARSRAWRTQFNDELASDSEP